MKTKTADTNLTRKQRWKENVSLIRLLGETEMKRIWTAGIPDKISQEKKTHSSTQPDRKTEAKTNWDSDCFNHTEDETGEAGFTEILKDCKKWKCPHNLHHMKKVRKETSHASVNFFFNITINSNWRKENKLVSLTPSIKKPFNLVGEVFFEICAKNDAIKKQKK